MPDVVAALSKMKILLGQLRPFINERLHYVPGWVRSLEGVASLLKKPSKTNISAALKELEGARNIVAGLVPYDPTIVNQFLKLMDEVKETLTQA